MVNPLVTRNPTGNLTTQDETPSPVAGSRKAITFASAGDSITADGGGLWNDDISASGNVYGVAWPFFAQLISDSRATWVGTFGWPGITITTFKNVYLPKLLAKAQKPKYCSLLIGENSLGIVGADVEYKEIVSSLVSANIIPILCTLTPASTDTNRLKFNTFIRQLAESTGLPLCDLHSAMVDPVTGIWKTGYNRDALHPTPLGASKMGVALADVLVKLETVNRSSSWIPSSPALFSTSRSFGSGSNNNQHLLLDNGAVPPIPTDWEILQSSHAAAISFTTPGGVVKGRKMKLQSNGTDLLVRHTLTYNAEAGDKLLVAFRFSASVEAFSGSWAFGLGDGLGYMILDVGRNSTQRQFGDCTDKIFVTTVTATGGWTWFDFVISGTSGSSVSVSEFLSLNLTSLKLT